MHHVTTGSAPASPVNATVALRSLAGLLLAGCSVLQPSIPLRTAQGDTPQTSWMSPQAKNSDLLYVSDGGNNNYVLTYPTGALIGKLTSSAGANGECVDNAGNVFVTNSAGYIDEYRHGGAKPFATLADYGVFPFDCAVDPSTGNLAVTNYPGFYDSHGNVAVYKRARGTPKLYADAKMVLYNACAYDNDGNLYLDGTDSGSALEFAELPKGSGDFTDITLDQPFQKPGSVFWDGKYLAVGSSNAGTIYRFKVSGATGTMVGKSVLDGVFSNRSVFFWIEDGRVIVPFGKTRLGGSNVGLWKYPAGGRYIERFHGFGGQSLFGVTVSPANR